MSSTLNKTVWFVATGIVLLAVALATSTFWILLSEQAATAGLFTLNFNLTKPPSPSFLQSGFLQNIQRGTTGNLVAAAAKTSDAADNAQRAVNSTVASLLQIEEHVPTNCSFGMIRFCIGFTRSRSCSSPRFTVSAIVLDKIQDLPSPLRDDIQAHVEELSSLPGSLNSLPTAIVGCLSTGPLSLIMLLLLSWYVTCGYPTRSTGFLRSIATRKQMVVHFGVGLICCVPYVVLVVVQHSVIRAVKQLPDWVEIEAGEVFGISIGAMVCAIAFAAFSAILSGYIRAQSIREMSVTTPSIYH